VSTFQPAARDRPADTVAGFLAALAMVGGAVAAVVRPVAIGLLAILIAFIATGLAERNQRLAAAGVAIAAGGFLTGMIVSVITSRPLW
jgi:hypothetical protein